MTVDVPAGVPDPAYRPGECNIGAAEVAVRRRFAILATAGTLGLEALLVAVRAPRPVRAVVGLPAAGAVIAIQQVRRRFCVAFGSRGVYNVAGPVGQVTPISDAAAIAADRRRVRTIVVQGTAVGLLSALIALRWP